MSSEETKQLQKKVNDYENKIAVLDEALNRKKTDGSDYVAVTLDCYEEQFYTDETKRMVLECIKRAIATYGNEERKWREYHLLKDVVDNNKVSEIGDNIKNDLMAILRNGNLSKQDVRELEGLGFVLVKGNHDKYVFHGDDRYIITVAKTPSDRREGENVAHDAVKLIFGRS